MITTSPASSENFGRDQRRDTRGLSSGRPEHSRGATSWSLPCTRFLDAPHAGRGHERTASPAASGQRADESILHVTCPRRVTSVSVCGRTEAYTSQAPSERVGNYIALDLQTGCNAGSAAAVVDDTSRWHWRRKDAGEALHQTRIDLGHQLVPGAMPWIGSLSLTNAGILHWH